MVVTGLVADVLMALVKILLVSFDQHLVVSYRAARHVDLVKQLVLDYFVAALPVGVVAAVGVGVGHGRDVRRVVLEDLPL